MCCEINKVNMWHTNEGSGNNKYNIIFKTFFWFDY